MILTKTPPLLAEPARTYSEERGVQQNSYPLEEPAYRAWIASLPDDAEVGTCGDAASCALVNFLRDLYKKNFIVGIRSYWLLEGDEVVGDMIPFPEWADQERRFFDLLLPFRQETHMVTAREYRTTYQQIAE